LRAADAAIDLTAIAGELADGVREAGALALKKFRSPMKSWFKIGNSPVSEVDIAVDEMLRERLTARTPDFGWLSEESIDDPSRLARDRVWILDPIDGTRAFLGGRDDWCIAVALAVGGRPVVGAIYAPVDDLLFLGVAGVGTTVNGKKVMANDRDDLADARAAGPQRYLDGISAGAPALRPMAKVHSLALRLARVGNGALDIAYAGANSHDWDVAAADIVVHEAGGRLTTLDGRTLTYNRPNPMHGALVAAGRKRHDVLLQLMRERHAAFA